jgi:hypothetical protein
MTQQIVINRCPRGTLLSPTGMTEYVRRKYDSTPPVDFTMEDIERTDAVLIQLMQENIPLYGGLCAQIKIVEVPDGFEWQLRSRGKSEWIAAKL